MQLQTAASPLLEGPSAIGCMPQHRTDSSCGGACRYKVVTQDATGMLSSLTPALVKAAVLPEAEQKLHASQEPGGLPDVHLQVWVASCAQACSAPTKTAVCQHTGQ